MWVFRIWGLPGPTVLHPGFSQPPTVEFGSTEKNPQISGPMQRSVVQKPAACGIWALP